MTMYKIPFGCTISRIASGVVYIVTKTSVRNTGVRCKITNRARDSHTNLFTITPERYVVNRDKSLLCMYLVFK